MSLRKGNTLISGAGMDGTNGQDGFSPSASVSKVGSISTLTVTDANGTTTATISDGIDSVTSIAEAYSSSSTYQKGDYVTYQGLLYVCNTTISSAENWTPAHWTETTAMSVVGNINTVLASLVSVGGNQ